MNKGNIKAEIDSRIEKIIKLIDEYAEFVNKVFIESKANKVNNEFYIFIDLLIRFRTNIKSVNLLLPYFKTDIEFKTPISLLLRSVNADVLTVCYLNSFCMSQDENKIGLQNEIKVLYKDYVNFLKVFGKEELELIKKYHPDWIEYIKQLELSVDNHISNYSEYYSDKKGQKKIISNFDLRKTTPDYFFFDSEEKRNPSSFVTEKYKFDRLKKRNDDNLAGQAFLAFKYYSQFQHYSTATIELLYLSPQCLDFRLLEISLENVFISTNLILKIVCNEGYKDEIRRFLNDLV